MPRKAIVRVPGRNCPNVEKREKRSAIQKRYMTASSLVDVPFSAAEEEFLLAVAKYRQRSRVRFPSATELLAVLLSLGYRKAAPADHAPETHMAHRKLSANMKGGV